MTENEVMLAEKVLGVLNNSSMKVVESYSSWFIYSSLTWIILSVICIYISLKNLKAYRISYDMLKKTQQNNSDQCIFYWASWVALVFSVFVLSCNIPDLLASDAAAIHQILKDIK